MLQKNNSYKKLNSQNKSLLKNNIKIDSNNNLTIIKMSFLINFGSSLNSKKDEILNYFKNKWQECFGNSKCQIELEFIGYVLKDKIVERKKTFRLKPRIKRS